MEEQKKAAVTEATAQTTKNTTVKKAELTYETIVATFKEKAAKAKAPVDARVAAQVKLDGVEYTILSEDDILAIAE